MFDNFTQIYTKNLGNDFKKYQYLDKFSKLLNNSLSKSYLYDKFFFQCRIITYTLGIKIPPVAVKLILPQERMYYPHYKKLSFKCPSFQFFQSKQSSPLYKTNSSLALTHLQVDR